jgi:tight adherence protein C
MALLAASAFFVALMITISIYGYRRYARAGRFYEQLGTQVLVSAPAYDSGTPPLLVRVIQRLGEQVPVSPRDSSVTRRELIAAGYRSDYALSVYYGLKALTCLACFLLAFLFVDYVIAKPILRILAVATVTFLGYFVPTFLLEHQITKRHETLRLSLPDALDMMVIAVEAGLGLDQTIQYVAREIQISHPELSEEWSMVTLEMRAGKRRAETLKNLADRTGEAEIRKLVAILIQTDRFGTSMAESLRTHSDFLRVRRRQEAEERAGKVGVRLVFPIFFFILPSMLVVAAGPGLLQVFKYLFPLMRQAYI